jgi:hypothetical protein
MVSTVKRMDGFGEIKGFWADLFQDIILRPAGLSANPLSSAAATARITHDWALDTQLM